MTKRKPKLTPWVLTADQPPPCRGWWNASPSKSEGERRWWTGTTWRGHVHVGDSDQCAAAWSNVQHTKAESDAMYWRGLAEPPK